MDIQPIPIPKDSRCLHFLYNTALGRTILKVLSSRTISELAGKYMDSTYSTSLIPRFIDSNNINLEDYEDAIYKSFNDCFTRRIKSELRPVDMESDSFIAPCDGLLSAYHIKKDTVLPIKQSEYTIKELVNNARVAHEFENGICLVFRLCVNHYHRYIYLDNAKKSKNIFIPGELHTVQPVALNTIPVFSRNCREYTLMKTDNFGTVLQMEVGAMLVGKICNWDEEKIVSRGEEKGCFMYGGSTIVVLVKKDKAVFDEQLFEATDNGMEVPVKMGEKIGIKSKLTN